jgi:hypothetical protein
MEKSDFLPTDDGGRVADGSVMNTSIFIHAPIASPGRLDTGSAPCVARAVVVEEGSAYKVFIRLGGAHRQVHLDVILVFWYQRAIVDGWCFAL